MPAPGTEPAERIRRVRRDDISALLHAVGGPEAGRVRALRRLTKTLHADVYVLDRDATLHGVVAVVYRRSLAHGGLTATIDALTTWSPAGDDARRRDERALVACALSRARRRGCVAVDSALAQPEIRTALAAEGFLPAATQLVLDLRGGDANTTRDRS